MIPSLSQEALTQYAAEAQTIQEPTGTDYTRGVSAGKTVPAKWWNWLFSAATKRIVQSRNDADNMLTELNNVVTDAGLTPTGSDSTQLVQAITSKVNTQIANYITDKQGYFLDWTETPVALDIPSDYRQRLIVCDDLAVCAAWPSSDTPATTFYLSFNTDGKTWTAQTSVTLGSPVMRSSTPIAQATSHKILVYCCKFKGRYFLLIKGNTSSQGRSLYAELFVSDDLVNWQTVRSVSCTLAAAAQLNTYVYFPSLGGSDDTLYFMTYEGDQYPTDTRTAHLYATTDGYSWTDKASGFTFPSGPCSGKVIPYGNGFIWGIYVYNGSTVSNVYSGLDTFFIENPIEFASGALLYPTLLESLTVLKGSGFGAVASTFQLTTSKRSDSKLSLVANGAYIVYQTNTSIMAIADVSYAQTVLTVPTGASTYANSYAPFQSGTYTYWDRFRSTDLSNWEAVPNLPEYTKADQHLEKGILDGQLWYVSATAGSGYIGYLSFDTGQTWRSTEIKQAIGALLFPDCCWGTYTDWTGGGVTDITVNFVIGNTLYLR